MRRERLTLRGLVHAARHGGAVADDRRRGRGDALRAPARLRVDKASRGFSRLFAESDLLVERHVVGHRHHAIDGGLLFRARRVGPEGAAGVALAEVDRGGV